MWEKHERKENGRKSEKEYCACKEGAKLRTVDENSKK